MQCCAYETELENVSQPQAAHEAKGRKQVTSCSLATPAVLWLKVVFSQTRVSHFSDKLFFFYLLVPIFTSRRQMLCGTSQLAKHWQANAMTAVMLM